MTILLTGGTGFIGSHLIKVLLSSGHKVGMTVRKKSGSKPLGELDSRVNCYEVDTYESFEQMFTELQPDCVFHLATLYINKHEPKDIPDILSSNITFGTKLLEAMSRTNCRKIINFGTRWQHVSDDRYNPANLYAASKEAFLCILKFYNKLGIKSKTIELCDTFGSGDTRKKVIDLMIDACKRNQSVDMSPGDQVLDIVSVDDVCDYINRSCVDDVFFDNTCISISGNQVKLKDLGSIIEGYFNTANILKWGNIPYRENEVMVPPAYYPIQKISSDSVLSQIRNYCLLAKAK